MSPIVIGFKTNSAGWDKCDGNMYVIPQASDVGVAAVLDRSGSGRRAARFIQEGSALVFARLRASFAGFRGEFIEADARKVLPLRAHLYLLRPSQQRPT